MKKRFFILIILITVVLFSSCMKKNDDPVGPALWIEYSEQDGINLNNYFISQTVLDLSFTGVGNLEGFSGEWTSKSGYQAEVYNITGKELMLKYVDIQPDGDGLFYVRWTRNFSQTTNLYDIAGNGEVLVFKFRTRCSNDGVNYLPQRIEVAFGADWNALGISDPNGDYSYYGYKIPDELPSDSWLDVTFFLSDLTRPFVNGSHPEAAKIKQITMEDWMKNVTSIKFSIPDTALSAGKNGIIFIDNFKILVYRHKSLYDPTSY